MVGGRDLNSQIVRFLELSKWLGFHYEEKARGFSAPTVSIALEELRLVK